MKPHVWALYVKAMRNQLGAKRRRLFDEILLDRHGRSCFRASLTARDQRALDCHINRDISRWPNSSVSADDCPLGKLTDESRPRNVSELVRTWNLDQASGGKSTG